MNTLGSFHDTEMMKNFEDITFEEKKEIPNELRKIPDESKDPIDSFIRSFNELSQSWHKALREIDAIYLPSKIESHITISRKKSRVTSKRNTLTLLIRRFTVVRFFRLYAGAISTKIIPTTNLASE